MTRASRAALLAVLGVTVACLLAVSAVLGLPGARPAGAAEVVTTGTTGTSGPTGTATPDPTTAPDPTAPTSEPTTEPTTEPTIEPTIEPTGEPTSGPVEVTDAVLRWGLSNESNNAAHEPGSFNFFSAGAVLPGLGALLRQDQWRASAGDVTVEKWNGSAWRTTAWNGWRTTSDGTPITNPGAGTFSNHQVVVRGGEGTVDRATGTARITWEGTFTVLYYSGRSFFHVTDPRLDVAADGTGTLTGSVSGYASSRDDPTQRVEVPAREVVLADLPSVDLDDPAGFTATPAYRGVRVTGTGQRTDVPDAGSFPQSFVTMMEELGTGPFWYSSGAATDPFKVALPLTVAYDASTPAPVPPPAPAPSDVPTVPENTALAPPARGTSGRDGTAAPVRAAPRVAAPAVLGVPVAEAAAAAPPLPAGQDLVAVSASSRPAASAAGGEALWWLGGGLLLGAAALVAVPRDRLPLRRSGGAPTAPPGAAPLV